MDEFRDAGVDLAGGDRRPAAGVAAPPGAGTAAYGGPQGAQPRVAGKSGQPAGSAFAVDPFEHFAENALEIFTEVEARRHKAGAHRLLGMIYRERSQIALAESHLRSALEMAANSCAPLIQADAAKELATLYQAEGRAIEALDLLLLAHELYVQLRAQADLADLEDRIESLCQGRTHT